MKSTRPTSVVAMATMLLAALATFQRPAQAAPSHRQAAAPVGCCCFYEQSTPRRNTRTEP
jgi:hypothetical protein